MQNTIAILTAQRDILLAALRYPYYPEEPYDGPMFLYGVKCLLLDLGADHNGYVDDLQRKINIERAAIKAVEAQLID